ncbi:hypothetical protein DAT35_29585 [Vitiosangium sp. GDMCC 1.1324]|nr:hypothetical protein DAT35_29585 [Vitiosangium sp. GDMCC 1.1324]
MTGVLTIELRDSQGALVDQRRVHNLITRGGKKLLANLLMGKVDALPNAWTIAVGTGSTQAQMADVALAIPVDGADARVDVIAPDDTSVVWATVTATLPERKQGEVQPLTEAGIRIKTKAGVEGILFNRVIFAPVNRGPNMQMTLSWEITF